MASGKATDDQPRGEGVVEPVEEGGDSSVEKKKLPFLELLRRMQGNEEDEELNKELGQLVSTCKSQIDDGGAYGRTALHLAAEGGLFGVAGKLIAAGANVSAEDTFGNQALHLASLKGHDKLASLLLEKGARLEAKDRSGLTPLMKACFSDKPKVVELLLGKGADVLASDEEGSSPLHLASLRGSDQIVRQLLEKDKSNIEATTTLNKETALHLASERGNAEVVSRLIDAGAVLNPQTSTEWTPLHLASIYGHAEVVSRLLDAGAVLNPHTFTGWTPLHLASIFGHVEVVSRLIDAWAEPNEQTIKQESFLRVPSESSYAEVGSRLLNIRDRNGKTALHLASGARDGQFWSHMAGGVRSQGRLEAGRHNSVLRLLLEQGAKLEITDNGEETALHLAARHGDPNRIKTLLKAQDMDEQVLSARNNKSQTALFVAFRGDKPENAMRTLLESKTLKIVDFGAEGLRLQVIQKLAKNPATHDIVARIFGWKAGTDSDNAVPSAIKGAVHERLPDVLSDLIDTSPDNEQKNNALETAFNEVLVVVRERNQRLESSYSMEANMSQSWNRINKNPLVDAETSSKLGESQGSKQGQLTQETIEQDESQQLLAILELLILNSPRTPQVEDNLKVSLLSTLGLVKTFVPRDERERLLNVLWHLISAAEPASDIKEKISEAISAVKKLTEDSKSLEQTNSTQDWEQDASNSHGPGSTDNTEAKDQEMGDNQDITDHNMQQTKQIDNDAEEYQRYLKTLEDILHNPFVRLRTHREKKTFQRPRAMLGDESILENYDITITQFLTGDVEQISRRYRSVKEVIYDEGPNHCTAKPFLGPTNTDQKSEPKVTFTWIHLPATNIVWMNDLLTRIMKDENYDNQTYYEVSSFFRDSWVEMPDGKSESRMMRPRAVVRDEEKLGQSKALSQEDTQSATTQNVTNELEKQKSSRTSLKEYAFVPASAIYMPYLCPSLCCHPSEKLDDGKLDDDSKKLKMAGDNDRALLKAYKDLPIHVSPTLDEWYYEFDPRDEQSKSDRDQRNRSQIYQKFQHDDHSNIEVNQAKVDSVDKPRTWPVLRVNELWVWTFANKFIISATSGSLDSTQDMLVDGLLDQITKQGDFGQGFAQLKTTDDLKRSLVEYCIGSYERRPKQKEKEVQRLKRPSPRQAFFQYIGKIGREEAALFQKFSERTSAWDKKMHEKENAENIEISSSETRGAHYLPSGWLKLRAKFRDTNNGVLLMNKRDGPIIAIRSAIKSAERLYCEAKDVRDELNIIKAIARFQELVQRNITQKPRDADTDADLSATRIFNDVKEMDLVSSRIESAVNTTLSLQQSELANNQAVLAWRQSKILMVFTFTTLLFLPLSFLSSLFALDVDSFLQTPRWAFVVIFLVSIGITVFLSILAIFWDEIAKWWTHLKFWLSNFPGPGGGSGNLAANTEVGQGYQRRYESV